MVYDKEKLINRSLNLKGVFYILNKKSKCSQHKAALSSRPIIKAWTLDVLAPFTFLYVLALSSGWCFMITD